MKPCEWCKGDGWRSLGGVYQRCHVCQGSGKVDSNGNRIEVPDHTERPRYVAFYPLLEQRMRQG